MQNERKNIKMNRGKNIKKLAVICLAGMTALALASCAGDTDPGKNLALWKKWNLMPRM